MALVGEVQPGPIVSLRCPYFANLIQNGALVKKTKAAVSKDAKYLTRWIAQPNTRAKIVDKDVD